MTSLKSLKKEYKKYRKEKQELDKELLSHDLYSHLKSFRTYILWRDKVKSLFNDDDNAKDL